MQKRMTRVSLIMGGLILAALAVGLILYFARSSTKKVTGITAEEVLALAAENLASVDETEQEWTLSYDYEGTSESVTYTSSTSISIDLKEKQSDGQIYMKVSMTAENQSGVEDETSLSSEAVSYIERQSDGWYNYTSTDDGDWYYAVVDEDTADVLLSEKEFLSAIHELDVTWTLAERTKRVEQKHAYVLTAEIPADCAMALLELFDMEIVTGEDETDYLSGKTVEVTYAIYEDTGLPAEISITFADLYTQIWDELASADAATATDADSDSSDSSEESTTDDSEMTINAYEASIQFTSYEVKKDISVPDEAKNTATPQTEDSVWTVPDAKEWYDYFIENRGTDLEGLYGITEDNYKSVTEEEWESIYYHEIGYD